jgi:sulfur oxidation c-type cytochrome SoxX
MKAHSTSITTECHNSKMRLIHLRLIFLCLTLLGLVSPALADQASRLARAYEFMTNQQGNCIACHDLPGTKGQTSNFAPSLKGVGAKWTREELERWLTDARVFNPDTLMPPYGSHQGLMKVNPARSVLTAEQIKDVVDILQTWR